MAYVGLYWLTFTMSIIVMLLVHRRENFSRMDIYKLNVCMRLYVFLILINIAKLPSKKLWSIYISNVQFIKCICSLSPCQQPWHTSLHFLSIDEVVLFLSHFLPFIFAFHWIASSYFLSVSYLGCLTLFFLNLILVDYML